MSITHPPEDPTNSHGAQLVRSLLARHAIPRHRQVAFVREFFQLSRAAAHQRMGRSTAWTLEELQRLANHFGESLTQVVSGEAAAAGTAATLQVGGMQVACRIWLVDDDSPHHEAFVALEKAGVYTVVPVTAAANSDALRVARLEIDQVKAALPRVAVLDESPIAASALCEQLGLAGLSATGYSSAAALATELAEAPFDGYVVHWSLGDEYVLPLLATIRSQPRHAAVVLLTGKLRSSSAAVHDIAAASAAFKVQVLEKSVHLPLLIAALENDGLRSP